MYSWGDPVIAVDACDTVLVPRWVRPEPGRECAIYEYVIHGHDRQGISYHDHSSFRKDIDPSAFVKQFKGGVNYTDFDKPKALVGEYCCKKTAVFA
jgi:hypothetical protein